MSNDRNDFWGGSDQDRTTSVTSTTFVHFFLQGLKTRLCPRPMRKALVLHAALHSSLSERIRK